MSEWKKFSIFRYLLCSFAAFCPYHIGHFTIMGTKMKKYISGAHFEGVLTTLCGYCVIGEVFVEVARQPVSLNRNLFPCIGFSLLLLHALTALFRLRKATRILGLCYIVVKVALLVVVELVAFPIVCGWWLDICSFALFDATLKVRQRTRLTPSWFLKVVSLKLYYLIVQERQTSYNNAPAASMFIHWLIGMVFVFYFASFVILLREVLRPGVLWFLRNLNDPDFNPIQEMIHLPVLRHLRRCCVSLVIFGTAILVMLLLPSKVVKRVFPNFLPYQTSQPS